MGRDKALVEVAGKPMIHWVTAALEQVTGVVLLAGYEEWEGWPGLPDPPGRHGPLAGLAAALELGQPLLVVAVDQPWVRPATLKMLAGYEGTAVPVAGGIRQVTCARYELSVETAAGGIRSVQELVDRVPHHLVEEAEWSAWGEDGRSWYSVDSPDEIEAGLSRFGAPG
jgi:molybdopterin-guanine dinucleotide biosynthesis protein A